MNCIFIYTEIMRRIKTLLGSVGVNLFFTSIKRVKIILLRFYVFFVIKIVKMLSFWVIGMGKFNMGESGAARIVNIVP